MKELADLGLVGLAVMGRNLALNMADHGFTVAVHNRTTERIDEFLAGEAAGMSILGAHTVEALVASLTVPRIVLLMVRAGEAVDAQLDAILPLLDPGDVVIDGGNSHYTDTITRTARLEAEGLRYVGMGISGGEEGARNGPSLMPGGTADAWPVIEPIFTSIAALAAGEPSASWVGPDGSGHFVKMVHNGIEYGDMQVIAEAYDILHRGLGMEAAEIAPLFAEWNRGKLESYLVEITAAILDAVDDEDGAPVVDVILDSAGQKGTGKWMVVASTDYGRPTTLVAEAVYARIVSSLVDERHEASARLRGPRPAIDEPQDEVIADLHDALYASKMVSYAQGFMLLDAAGADHDWDLDPGTIASLWRAGCVIRSQFLDEITDAYRRNPALSNFMLDDYFRSEIDVVQAGWRRTVSRAVGAGIPVPAYAGAVAFYDAYRSKRLPASLLQAQRDYFGAHTYERVDRPRGEFFHTDWTGHGGDVTASTYSV